METALISYASQSAEAIAHATRILQNGGLVAFPTETVYGLGASAYRPQAIADIFAVKGRPSNNPLIVHVHSIQQAIQITREIPDAAKQLMAAFWPGPLTLVLPRSPRLPESLSAGLPTVAVRMPQHDAALALIAKVGPVVAPSANRSGRPSPTDARRVLEDLGGRIPLIIDGGRCTAGLESTVLDMSGSSPTILRPGHITREMLEELLGNVDVAEGVLQPVPEGTAVSSPGLLHRHYAPSCPVTLYKADVLPVLVHAIAEQYDTLIGKPAILATDQTLGMYGDRWALSLGDRLQVDTIANNFFEALRQLDAQGATHILAEAIPEEGLGLAVMNRALRAACFHMHHVEGE